MAKVSVHQRKARSFIQREEWSNALGELERLLDADSSNPTLHNQIGDVYLRKEDIENACSHFESAVDLYASVGLYNNAVALCKKIMRLRPARVEVRQRLARLRLQQGFRGEAVTYFSEYLDHVHLENEEQATRLENECRDFVEALTDEAPIGKILEKLESGQRFACALEIVGKLAQKAADGGDEKAAVRYTQKIRSLRVLVERSGGRDRIASWVPGDEETSGGVLQDPADEEPVKVSPAEPNAALQEDTIEPERRESDLDPEPAPEPTTDRLQPDEQDPTGPMNWPEPVEASDPSGTSQVHDTPDFEDIQDPLEEAVVSDPVSSRNPTRTATPEPGVIEMEDGSSAPPEPESAAEYELEEVSFDEVQSLLEDDEEQEDRDAKSEDPGANPVAEIEEVRPTSSEPHAADTMPDTHANPVSEIAEPEPTPSEPHAADTMPGNSDWSELRRASVWVPADNDEPDPGPETEQGSHMQLEHVIDSFREQMARALDGDGSSRYDLGVAYFDMGLYNEALAEFEAASCSPELEVRCLEMQAACLLEQGRHGEILELLQPVLAAKDTPEASELGLHYAAGLAHEALGDPEQARKHFEVVVRVDAHFKDVQTRLERA